MEGFGLVQEHHEEWVSPSFHDLGLRVITKCR
jgi:hypothetical protein